MHHRQCFLQCDWQLENLQSTLIRPKGLVERHQTLSSRMRSGHKTSLVPRCGGGGALDTHSLHMHLSHGILWQLCSYVYVCILVRS